MGLYRILVVDDEELQREMLGGFLQKEGFSVSLADSGENALKLCQDDFFEVALIDLKMPGMDGIELLSRLKEINPEIQVIVITAHGSIETAVEAMRKGAFHYVNKPVDLEELKINVKKSLENQKVLAGKQIPEGAVRGKIQGLKDNWREQSHKRRVKHCRPGGEN